MSDADELRLRTRIWIEDERGRMIFGLGRLRMLEAIHQSGSISAAARELGMSYKAVWERLTVTEKRLGRQLVIRRKGGASGGSSRLSNYALKLVAGFHALHGRVLDSDDRIFEEVFRPLLEKTDP